MLLTVWFYFFLVVSSIIASAWVILATIVNPQIDVSFNDHPYLGIAAVKERRRDAGSPRPGESGTNSPGHLRRQSSERL